MSTAKGEPGEPGKKGEPGSAERGGTGGRGGAGGAGAPAPTTLPGFALALWAVAGANIIMFLVVAGLAFYVYVGFANNRDALCSLKSDLEVRVENTRAYINAHDEPGESLPILPLTQLRVQAHNQQATVDSLSDIDCG
jgi:hypothetical protein